MKPQASFRHFVELQCLVCRGAWNRVNSEDGILLAAICSIALYRTIHFHEKGDRIDAQRCFFVNILLLILLNREI